MNKIGIQIKKAREEKGWTQEELAKRMGYKSKSTINKIELGINDVAQSKIVKFSDVLGVSLSYLMGWEQKKIDAASEMQNDVYEYIASEETLLKDFLIEISDMGFSPDDIKIIRKYAHAIKKSESSTNELHMAYVDLFVKMYELGLSIEDLNDIYTYAQFIISKKKN